MRKFLFYFFTAALFLTTTGRVLAQGEFDTPPLAGFFYIQSVQAGSANAGYWDQPGVNARFKQGVKLTVYAKDNGQDQRFRFIPAGDGSFFIVSQNGGYLDIAGGRTANGTAALLWKGHRQANQRFRFQHRGDGRWKIFSISGRILCLANRSHENGSPVHLWENHEGSFTEWFFEDAASRKRYQPPQGQQAVQNPPVLVSGIAGKLEAVDYDSELNGKPSHPGITDIEVWVFEPASNPSYVKKKTVKTDAEGNFDLGQEFDAQSSIFLLSRSENRSSAMMKLYPSSKKKKIEKFISEKIDSKSCVLVETYHRGKQYYCESGGIYYLRSGMVTQSPDFYFAGMTSVNLSSPGMQKLLKAIKAGPAAKTDEEARARLEGVFDFLRTSTKDSMGSSAAAEIKTADIELFSNCRLSPRHGLNRWPKLEEYAAVYEKHGFIPTANCTSWAHLAATLLHAAGMPPERFFVAKFNYDMSWIVEHWVIGLKIGNRWYSLDPQARLGLRFPDLKAFQNLNLDRERTRWDHLRPFEAYVLPGSNLEKVPYLGNPETLKKSQTAGIQ